MTDPSETKLVELSDEERIDAVFDRLAAEGRTIRHYKLLTPEIEAKIADLESALASLADELRLAREDAARYRFIRNLLAIEDIERLIADGNPTPDEQESVRTDAAIDAALKEPR